MGHFTDYFKGTKHRVGILAEKSSWERPTDGKNLVWFGEIERKLAKLSMTTFAYRSSS
jgi:hypothetical protein